MKPTNRKVRLIHRCLNAIAFAALWIVAGAAWGEKALDLSFVNSSQPLQQMNIKDLRKTIERIAKTAPKCYERQDILGYIKCMEQAVEVYDEAVTVLRSDNRSRRKGTSDFIWAYSGTPQGREWSVRYSEYSECMYGRSLALKYAAQAHLTIGNRLRFEEYIEKALDGLREMVNYRDGHQDIETRLEMAELLLLQNKIPEAGKLLEGLDREFKKLEALDARDAATQDVAQEEQVSFERFQIIGQSSTQDNVEMQYKGLSLELDYRSGHYEAVCQAANKKDSMKALEDATAGALAKAVSPVFILPNALDFLMKKGKNKGDWSIKQSELGDRFYTFGFEWINAPLHLVNPEKDAIPHRGDIKFIQNLKPRWFIALSAYQIGDTEMAKKNLEKILASEATLARTDPAIWWTSHYYMGKISEYENKLEEARQHYAKAIDIIENLRNSLLTDQLKLGFTENKNLPYDGAVRSSLALNDTEAAFVYSERARARALLDLLENRATGKTIVASTSPSTDKGKDQTEMAPLPLDRLPKSMFQTRSPSGEASATPSKETELNSILGAECLTAQTIQGFLGGEDSLVEYFLGENQLAIFVVNKDAVTVETVKKNAKEIQETIEAFRTSLLSGAQEFRSSSRDLYQTLIGPVEGRVRKHLIIVPHLQLHKVPFAALMSNDGSYLVESKVVSTIYSGSTLKYLAGKGGKSLDRMLAFANPSQNIAAMLPSTEREVAAVSPLFSESKVLLRDQATKSFFLSNAKGYDVIHFACHGKFYPDNPADSCLLLGASENQDGMLKVGDIYQTDLAGCSLVTLSACETGLGKETSGDDVLGLGRAFICAGAPRLVASLWSVADEATADLMKDFYTHLKQGQSASEALRNAQLAMLHRFGDRTVTRGIAAITQQKAADAVSQTSAATLATHTIPFDHPFFWASFIVIGDCR